MFVFLKGEISVKRILSLIFTYFTVAVLLTVAVAPFWDNNDIELLKNDAEAVASDGSAEVLSPSGDEEYSEGAKTESRIEEIKTEQPAVSEDVTEAVTEAVTEVSGGAYTEENTEKSDSSSQEEGSFVLNLPESLTYVPGGKNENVTGLNFFTDTYGMLETSDSINVYTFTLDSSGAFRYTFNHPSTNDGSGWKIGLYQEYLVNGSGEKTALRLINELVTASDSSDSSPEIGLIKGNYRLVVTANGRHSEEVYRISVSHSAGVKYETECNDNVMRYNEIYAGVPIRGSASRFPDKQDADWYMFRMYSDGYVELDFSHPEVKDQLSVCWQVIFYSEDMTEIFSVNSTFTDKEFSSGRIGLHAGNYYIAVINRVYTDITYTLTLSRTGIEGFENERNDTFETADKMYENSTVTGSVSSQINGLDRDYFTFSLSEKGILILEFAHNPISDAEDKQGWNFRLTDKNGKVIYAGISAWADDVSASTAIGLPKGTYYVIIDSEGLYHSAERYYLSTVFTPAKDIETELNDSADTADKLSEGISLSAVLSDRGSDYDYDWYTFTLSKSSDISIDFSHEVLSYSREIFTFTLYDENMNVIKNTDGKTASGVLSDKDTVTAEFSSLPEGKYYVKVSTGIFFDTIGYFVKYNTVTKES